MVCPGSAPLELRYVELSDNDQPRKEGDAAHFIASAALHTRTPASTLYAPGFIAPNGIVVDEEMLEAVDIYVHDVLTTLPEIYPQAEKVVRATRVHEDNWGTVDAYKWKPVNRGGLLAVWDYKHGHGFIDAFENWQTIDYSLAILEDLERQSFDLAAIEVVMTVVQPRNYSPVGPIRRWTVNAAELRRYEHQLSVAAAEAMGPNPRTVPGPQCQHCNGRFGCDALHAAADRAADLAGTAVPLDLPPDALATELKITTRAFDLLEARKTGLEAMGTAMIKAGKKVPGFGLEQTTGKETWTATPEEVFAIGDAMGIDLRRAAPITPNQARKAGLDESLVKSYVHRPPGALKLKPVDETQARKVFGK